MWAIVYSICIHYHLLSVIFHVSIFSRIIGLFSNTSIFFMPLVTHFNLYVQRGQYCVLIASITRTSLLLTVNGYIFASFFTDVGQITNSNKNQTQGSHQVICKIDWQFLKLRSSLSKYWFIVHNPTSTGIFFFTFKYLLKKSSLLFQNAC